MRYIITGADRETGDERCIEVVASSTSEAESLAYRQRLLVSNVKPISRPRKAIVSSWTIAAIALIVTFTLGFFVGREYLKHEASTSIRTAFSAISQPQSPPSANRSSAGPQTTVPEAVTRSPKPEFDVTLKRFGDHQIACQSYVITNESTTPLTIKRVVYNGEFEAKRGEHDGVWVNNSDEGFPVTLSIGDYTYAVRTTPGHFGIQQSEYTKSIIFLEVHTDRGVFKFSPSGRSLD